MAKIVPLDERYEWSDDKEFLNAQILPPANIGFIKTQLALDRRKLTNLCPDPNNYAKFIQEHASLAGAISAYEFLLNCHNEVMAKLAVD